MDQRLLELGERVGAKLRQRGETVAIAESSSGGLISAALLAVAGASAYFRGGGAVYTGDAKARFLGLSVEALSEPRAATEGHALVLARGVRERLGTSWGVGETGAAGPTGNRYGDAPGHTCVAVDGAVSRAGTLETGTGNRRENMIAFALEALRLLDEALDSAG